LLPRLLGQLQPGRPLDRHRQPVQRRALERRHRSASLLSRPRYGAAQRRQLQPDRQLDPHRQHGRHRPCLPLPDLPDAAGARGDRESSSPRLALIAAGRRRAFGELLTVEEDIRRRIYEITLALEPGTPEEKWPVDEREFTVAHDYDTPDRDLEQLGMTLSRLPSEAGVEWRLALPRGERVEAWGPGANGLGPPRAIRQLGGSGIAGKPPVPRPPPTR